MLDYRRCPSLNYVNGNIECSAEGQNLGLATPSTSVSYATAVFLELRTCNQTSICRSGAVLSNSARQEWDEVVGM